MSNIALFAALALSDAVMRPLRNKTSSRQFRGSRRQSINNGLWSLSNNSYTRRSKLLKQELEDCFAKPNPEETAIKNLVEPYLLDEVYGGRVNFYAPERLTREFIFRANLLASMAVTQLRSRESDLERLFRVIDSCYQKILEQSQFVKDDKSFIDTFKYAKNPANSYINGPGLVHRLEGIKNYKFFVPVTQHRLKEQSHKVLQKVFEPVASACIYDAQYLVFDDKAYNTSGYGSAAYPMVNINSCTDQEVEAIAAHELGHTIFETLVGRKDKSDLPNWITTDIEIDPSDYYQVSEVIAQTVSMQFNSYGALGSILSGRLKNTPNYTVASKLIESACKKFDQEIDFAKLRSEIFNLSPRKFCKRYQEFLKFCQKFFLDTTNYYLSSI